MNKKIKRKWVAALRGGNYTQIFAMLGNGPGRRCALGVLADVVGLDGENEATSYGTIRELSGASALQTNEVLQMNDTYGWTFEQIADRVEEHY